MEESYCSTCQQKTQWFEFDTNWQCLGCGHVTQKRSLAECIEIFEAMQEQWAEFEKHLTESQNALVEPLKLNIDLELRKVK